MDNLNKGKVMEKKLIFLLAVSFLCAATYSQAAEENNFDNSILNEGAGEISSDIFGKKGGYLHPFLSLAELYSDNIFNENSNTVSDYATILSPGIWLSIPGTRKQVLEIDSSSATPGGLDYDIYNLEKSRRFQSYMLFAADFSMYSDQQEADTEDYQLEGSFQYNFGGGLSIQFIDQFIASHDDWNTG
jgi:hypothetical protein